MADPVWQDGVTPINAVNMNKLQTRDEKGAVNGYAPLGADGKVPSAQLPAPVATGANLTYRGDWADGTYVDGDVVVAAGIAYLCVGGPTVVPPDPNLWDDLVAPVTTTPWVPLWSLAAAGGVATGALLEFAGATAPPGFLMADGASYPRATFGALFGVIGTTYGSWTGRTSTCPTGAAGSASGWGPTPTTPRWGRTRARASTPALPSIGTTSTTRGTATRSTGSTAATRAGG